MPAVVSNAEVTQLLALAGLFNYFAGNNQFFFALILYRQKTTFRTLAKHLIEGCKLNS